MQKSILGYQFHLPYECQHFASQILQDLQVLANGKVQTISHLIGVLNRFKGTMLIPKSRNGKGLSERQSNQVLREMERQRRNRGNFKVNLKAMFSVYKADSDILGLYRDIARFVLEEYEKQQEPIPMIIAGISMAHTFRKSQVLLIICLMAIFLVPEQEYWVQHADNFHDHRDFSYIFKESRFKTECIVEFLKIQLRKNPTGEKNSEKMENQDKLTIIRLVASSNVRQLLKGNQRDEYCKANDNIGIYSLPKTGDKSLSAKMTKFYLKGNIANIEEFTGNLKVDFANEYIGGGALGKGLIQQEIMFATHPEMFISMLLCESMGETEAIGFVGFRKYFRHEGYSNHTRFIGYERQPEISEKDSKGRVREYIVGIDALNYGRKRADPAEQFCRMAIDRQILKSYTGFQILSFLDQFSNNEQSKEKIRVITGNWGCGAFKGNKQLKLMIQWIAASMAGKEIVYCPFGSYDFLNERNLTKSLEGKSVEEVYKLVIGSGKTMRENRVNNGRFFDLMTQSRSPNSNRKMGNDGYGCCCIY